MATEVTDTAADDVQTLLATLRASDSGTSTTSSTSSSSVATGHYWTVRLKPVPPGAAAGTKVYLAMAEAEIQTAVDLLGRGLTEPPPNVGALLKPVVYESIGKGLTATQYEAALTKVESTQTALLTMDNQVIRTAIVVSAASDQTLRAIKSIVSDLNSTLAAVGSGKLTSTQNVAVMKNVAAAVEAVYEKVTAVAESNASLAGDSDSNSDSGGATSDSGGSGSGGSGSGGSGSDGLSSLIQGLASMAPMLAMAATPVVQELLRQNADNAEKAEEQQKTDGQQTAAPAGAVPAPDTPAVAAPDAAPMDAAPMDTTAPPITTAPGGPGQLAASSPAPPTTPATTAPAANSPIVPARRSTRRPTTQVDSTQDVVAAEDTDADAAIAPDSAVLEA